MQTPIKRAFHIFQTICNRISNFLYGTCPGFMHVIATNADAIEFGHMLAGEFNDICNDAHRWIGRINECIAHHEFFQNIILNRSGKCVHCYALFLSGNNEHCENGNHSSIHSHGDRHCIERYSIKKCFHVFDRINRNACFSHITNHARMIRVISTMCGKIKCHRQSFLSGSKIPFIKTI